MNELIFKWRLPLFNLRLFLGKAGNLASNKTFVDFDLNSIRWSCHLFCSTVYLQSSCWYNQCISWSSSIIYSLNNIFWVSYNSVILWKRDNNLSFVKDPGTSVYDNYLALIFRYGCSYHLIGKHIKNLLVLTHEKYEYQKNHSKLDKESLLCIFSICILPGFILLFLRQLHITFNTPKITLKVNA